MTADETGTPGHQNSLFHEIDLCCRAASPNFVTRNDISETAVRRDPEALAFGMKLSGVGMDHADGGALSRDMR
jgi:hypothetical protein